MEKTVNPHFDPLRSQEQQEPDPNAPSRATALFMRGNTADAAPGTNSNEISMLLAESPAAESDRAMAASQAVAERAPLMRPRPEELSAAQLASLSAKDAASPVRQVDLSGIFRKVKAKDVAGEGSQAEAPVNGASSPHLAENTYRTYSHVDAAPAPTEGDPAEGFTQMFRALSAASRDGRLGSESAPGHSAIREHERESVEGGSEPAQWGENPLRGSRVAQEPGQQLQAPGRGQYTRLFQRLGGQGPSTAPTDERLSAPLAVPQLGGGFTELLRTLSVETEVEVPALPAVPVILSPQSPKGPGEFTRIISGSMLREAQGRTGTPAVQNDELPERPRPSESGEGAQLREAEQSIAFAASTPLNSFTPPRPQVEPAPRIDTPATSKLQQYTPLLLIGNLFVMLLVLVLVGFALLRH